MSILEANGAVACAECGRQARAVRDRLQAENAELRELVRRLVCATHPADRAALIANAAELGIEVDK